MKLNKKYVFILLVIMLISGSIVSSILLYNTGLNVGYEDAREEYSKPNYDYWLFLQDNKTENIVEPVIGFGLNFSDDTEDIQLKHILNVTDEEVYGITITASKGNLTEYGFMLIFNDAAQLHYYFMVVRYYESMPRIVSYPGKSINRSDFSNGIHYPTSFINFIGFNLAKSIVLVIVVSDIIFE